MTPARYFCSEAARQRREHLFGTAPVVETWLLVESAAAWTSKSFPDNALPPAVRAHLAQMHRSIPRSRPLMIRQCHSRRPDMQFHLVRSAATESGGVCRRFRDDEDLLQVSAQQLLPAVSPIRPMYLVCTHGKHDQCCAKFGFSTFCAIRDAADTAAWECSHLGG